MAGRIDVSALKTAPGEKEFKTAKFFSNMGKDIVFICPSNIKGNRRPDFVMDGIEWEVKCPEGKSKRTIEKNMANAEGQSSYIIIDLRWVKLQETFCLSQIEINFKTRTKIKRVLVITKSLKLIEFS